ncbi:MULTISPECIES: hypothetical protein [unclassified Frankia]|uniref:hypothetical protein n=1 Tax=unclassified Frankia TaxID=2632575 RepID=UPI002AD20B8E|nr:MULTISPECIES: hypothetical protein [unclassified Frankia]
MSTHRPRQIGRDDAERMLRGGTVNRQAGPGSLADLLAAAAGSARVGELAGEESAVAAFREARLAPVTQPRRDSPINIGVGKLLTVKAVTVVVAATTVGGFAVVASTVVLPSPGGSDSPAAQLATSASASASAWAHEATSSGHGRNASPAVSASLVGLCRAYTAGAADNPGKALDTPAYSALVTAAGGKGQVPTYCAAALADDRAAGESTNPTGTVTPTAEPESQSAGHGKGHATKGADKKTKGQADDSEGSTPASGQATVTVAPGTTLEASATTTANGD